MVRLADHLIRHNHPPGTPPRLSPRAANPDGEVHVVQWASLAQEAAGLARFIRSLVDDDHAPDDIMVLSPRRLIGYGIRDALRAQGVNVHSFYHEAALLDDRAQEAFTLLTLAAAPDDRVSLRWWLGAESPTWRSGQYQVLREHCQHSGESPRDALERLTAGTLLIPRTNQLVERYNELKARLAALDGVSIEEVVNVLFPDGQEWAGGLREPAILAAAATNDLAELKDRVTTGITQPEMPESGDFVRVMSLHKSKGLTCQSVIIAGCMEGVIPFVDPDEPPAKRAELLREQRRLFYVAITLCTDRLVLSSVTHVDRDVSYKITAKTRRNGGTISSQFVHELGPEQPTAVIGVDWAAAAYQ